MTLPPLTATYRLQFREGMTFARAAALVPYVADLGVSHLYASPIFAATSGSTHGYDVTDPGALDEALGGRAGFEAMSDALLEAGLGLILDIVPNHMAFSLETPWLADVLRHGEASRYARHFDIDWSRGRLVLPWLGEPFAAMNAEGAFAAAEGMLAWDGMAVPLRPDGPQAAEGPEAIAALHEAQHWRLTDWRLERDGIHHRRFFNITSLIGVRVEEDAVFEDVHRLLFEMVEAGRVQGIRIDHVDGLADPAAYLDRLRARSGEVPIWVEKIMTRPEALPDWPVEGTTGYEAGADIAAALTEADGARAVAEAYAARLDAPQDFEAMVLEAKRAILGNELAAERLALTGMLIARAAEDPEGADLGPDTLMRALIELCAAMPVYRTYLDGAEPRPEDCALLAQAADDAAAHLPERAPLDFLVSELLGGRGQEADRLRVRFQQATGALMAKAKEDTVFYRFTRLISANDVGAEPEMMHLCAEAFHATMAARLAEQPRGLTLTSSHDTKRSEDARARVAAITHAPEDFFAAMDVLDGLPGAEAVPPHVRWYLGQSLVAAWGPDPALAERLREHMRKALREGKEFTTWTHPDAGFEDAVLDLAGRAVAHWGDTAPAAQVLAASERLVLVQAALKLLVSGVPDIYQGCEGTDFSLTDPDNRRPPDFEALAALAAAPDGSLAARKLGLTRACLALRRRAPALFLEGGYRPLALPEGSLGVLREHAGASVALVARMDAGACPVPPEIEGMSPVWGVPEADPVVVRARL